MRPLLFASEMSFSRCYDMESLSWVWMPLHALQYASVMLPCSADRPHLARPPFSVCQTAIQRGNTLTLSPSDKVINTLSVLPLVLRASHSALCS